MSLPSITPSTFTLKKSGDAASVAAAVSLGADGKTATLDPNSDLTSGATYTATITTGVEDFTRNAMTSPKTWSFTVAQLPPDNTIVNLPVTAVTASGNDGNVPANAFDNNLATRWSNNGLGSWIKADLGSPKTISYVDIASLRGTTRTNTFDIAVSNDGTTFTNVFHGQNSRAVNGLERFHFPDSNGRFVKVTVTGNTENNYASINEIDIYGFNKAIEGLPMNKTYDKDVLVIKYFPLTKDRILDFNVTGDPYLQGVSYETIKQRTIDITNNTMSAIGKATSYLGYKDSSAKPAIRYHIYETIEHEQPVPIAPMPAEHLYPDYKGIMQSHNICDYVDNKKIDEVWIFAYSRHSR